MNLRQIAALIPAEYRKEMLTTNMISKALAQASDPSMFYLFTIWKNYVEQSADLHLECNACLTRVLDNLRQMQPTLIELERESQLLNEV